MSIKRMHAGDSYRYLLRTIVDGEHAAQGIGGSSMTRYYAEAGTPPGRWLGSGLTGLDRGSGLAVGSVVTEEQMERLFKYGLDPVTGDSLARKAFEVPLSWGERAERRIAALSFDLTGEARAAQSAEIIAAERGRTVRRPVAGYDLTFSPPKSLSTLWGLAGSELREQLYAAHRVAVADTITLIERDVARTRIGTDGAAQVETRGVIAAAFDHYDSRAGDPQLHTHVVLANRVQGRDGRWRTLDSHGALFPSVVAMSETYDALLADHVTARTGLQWERRGNPRKAKNQRWEIAGVPEQLISEFSQRGASIGPEKDRLVAQWTDAHGREPDDATVIRLRQQATLSTRPDKQIRSLVELTADWRGRAAQVLNEAPTRWAARLTGRRVGLDGSERGPETTDVRRHADVVLEQLTGERSTWRRWNVHAEAARVTMAQRVHPGQRDQLVAAVTDEVLGRCVRLTGPALAYTPASFRQADGRSAFDPASRDVFTAEPILDAERRLLSAGRASDGPTTSSRTASGVAHGTPADVVRLSADQADALVAIATSGRRIDVLVGPAGAGKTTTLDAVRRAWEIEHGAGSVIGLAPSAAAAEVLADTLGIATDNTAKWITEHHRAADPTQERRHHSAVAALRGAATRADETGDRDAADAARAGIAAEAEDRDRWRLRAGQLVIIDEASLAGTLALDAICAAASEVDAKVLLVGDWAQLSAVEAGGAFGMLVRDRGDAPELTGVRRFSHPWERDASKGLRRGDERVIDEYVEHGRVSGGEQDAMLDEAYTAWSSDVAAGRTSLLIAADNHTARDLNIRARVDRVTSGHVAADGVPLHDGTTAGTGDRVVTRHNDRTLSTGRGWVKNGDRWQVLAHHPDGSLHVRRKTGGPAITLPAEYVAEHVELGYATTAHRAQGLTVDTAHAIVSGSATSREVLYVAMTRGRHTNHAYVCTDGLDDACDVDAPEQSTVAAADVLMNVLRNAGTQLSAHETIRAEQEQRNSIKTLAAEYDTIAQHAHTTRWSALLARVGWDPDQVRRAIQAPAAKTLLTAFRRADANGLDTATALPQLASAPLPEAAAEATAELAHRVQRWADKATDPGRRPGRHFIAGLIPIASPAADPDTDRALTERADLMNTRATELVIRAIRDREPWVAAVGGRPTDPTRAAAWDRHAATIAAYRDRYDLTSSEPLGAEEPRSWSRRADHRRAASALEATQQLRTVNHPHTPPPLTPQPSPSSRTTTPSL